MMEEAREDAEWRVGVRPRRSRVDGSVRAKHATTAISWVISTDPNPATEPMVAGDLTIS
jgi:hypothetical protein